MFTAQQFRQRANQMVGVPYVLGAEWSKSCVAPCVPRALDCSELVEGLFRENGTPIGDLAASQYDKTVAVGSGRERVGDLVFLRNNRYRWNGIGHVAVLTAKLSNGDWEIVESKGSRYGTVRTTLSYWKTRGYYTGVRRFPGFALKPLAQPLSVITPLPSPDTQKRAPRKCTDEDPTFLKIVQRTLGVRADGIRGPITDRAIRRRQQSLGVAIDGHWHGGTTLAYLMTFPNLRRGDKSRAVEFIQYIVGTPIDGVFGPATEKAVKMCQAWAGVDPDGIVGRVTKREIVR